MPSLIAPIYPCCAAVFVTPCIIHRVMIVTHFKLLVGCVRAALSGIYIKGPPPINTHDGNLSDSAADSGAILMTILGIDFGQNRGRIGPVPTAQFQPNSDFDSDCDFDSDSEAKIMRKTKPYANDS
ncbi:hypothetical protein B0H16DRAFT_1449707 [Mycena metata]|uniref:Uncharacterized protein n=1 Tax=Mycena metata TaxID=1033252 RepID=A0AAD7K1E2_9AGAR|nr:hypothetical protein B0H16DRAFT_1449707 [Mycena metata]